MSTTWRKNIGSHEYQYKKNRQIILARDNVCAICGREVDKTLKAPHPMSASVDHIIPLSKGGHPSDINNLQLAHRICNIEKGDTLTAEEFKEKSKSKITNRDLPHLKNWENYKSSV